MTTFTKKKNERIILDELERFSQPLPCQLVKYDLKVRATDLNPLLSMVENNYSHQEHICHGNFKFFIRGRTVILHFMIKKIGEHLIVIYDEVLLDQN